MRKRKKGEKFDFRFVTVVVILAAIVAGAWMLNTEFDGVSVEKYANALMVDDGDTKVNWGRYPIYEVELTESLTITRAGTYHLTGVLDGAIVVKAENVAVKLVLDNVTIRNADGPAIYNEAADELVIELVGDNYLEDGTKYAATYDKKVNGVIYSQDDLTLQGEGTLNVVGKYGDGIVSKDDLKFVSGQYNVVAVDDGIKGSDSVHIVNGGFVVRARGDAIKATNGERDKKGFILIEGGKFDLQAAVDGIQAVETVLVRGGEFAIEAGEGIEGRVVIIDGGKIVIDAVRNGLNAKSDYGRECLIYVNGGETEIVTSRDGLDANGKILLAGGKLTISLPKGEKNEALDADYGVEILGGELTIEER